VCNRKDDAFEPTDGDGYAEWWHGRDALTGGHLKKVTRLLKYLRDVKETFSVKSVLLTTLIGERISEIDPQLPGKFTNVPTALKTVMRRLDDWLKERPHMPEVNNPTLDGESFTRDWTQDQYDEFREKIQQYREWIDEAYDEADRDESIRKWRRVFGDEFAKGETVDRATKAVAQLAESFQRGRDLVAVVLAYGQAVLARMPRMLPHVEPAPYRQGNREIPVRITAYEKRTKAVPGSESYTAASLLIGEAASSFRQSRVAAYRFPRTIKYGGRW
jgi:hypothetical protein